MIKIIQSIKLSNIQSIALGLAYTADVVSIGLRSAVGVAERQVGVPRVGGTVGLRRG